MDQRLHALRLGFDDALTLGIPHDEFLGRLALLDEDTQDDQPLHDADLRSATASSST